MKTWFVDANVFLRFFTRDENKQHEQAARLFRRAQAGKVRLITGPPVLFEVAWTLRSAYRKSRLDVLELLEGIMSLEWLRLSDREVLEEAVGIVHKSGSEFADAYILAAASLNGADGVATFNRRDFEKMGAELYKF